MSFLTLNGLIVPVRADAGALSVLELGDRVRAFDGSLLTSRRAHKREWAFNTIQEDQDQILALMYMLLGLGDSWDFDSDTHSAKGLVAQTTESKTVRASTGADGDDVPGDYKYGTGSVAVDAGSTNISEIDDTDNSQASWTMSGGASAADDNTNKYVGSGAVKLTFAAQNETGQVRTKTGASATTTYACAFYAKSLSGDRLIRARLRDVTNAVDGSWTSNITVTQNDWVRVKDITVTTGAGSPNVELQIEFLSASVPSDVVVDAIILEQAAFSTSYLAASAGARAAGFLDFTATFMTQAGGKGVTVAMWTTGPNLSAPLKGTLFRLQDVGGSGGNLICRNNAAGADNVVFRTNGSCGGTDDLTYSTSLWDGAWHHIAFVLRAKAVNSVRKEIYLDGTLVASNDPAEAAMPDLTALDELAVGQADSTDFLNGMIDELFVLPYAASAEQIAALAAMTVATPGLPGLRAEGDFTEDDYVEVEGQLQQTRYDASMGAGGTWRNNAVAIAFRLLEV